MEKLLGIGIKESSLGSAIIVDEVERDRRLKEIKDRILNHPQKDRHQWGMGAREFWEIRLTLEAFTAPKEVAIQDAREKMQAATACLAKELWEEFHGKYAEAREMYDQINTDEGIRELRTAQIQFCRVFVEHVRSEEAIAVGHEVVGGFHSDYGSHAGHGDLLFGEAMAELARAYHLAVVTLDLKMNKGATELKLQDTYINGAIDYYQAAAATFLTATSTNRWEEGVQYLNSAAEARRVRFLRSTKLDHKDLQMARKLHRQALSHIRCHVGDGDHILKAETMWNLGMLDAVEKNLKRAQETCGVALRMLKRVSPNNQELIANWENQLALMVKPANKN